MKFAGAELLFFVSVRIDPKGIVAVALERDLSETAIDVMSRCRLVVRVARTPRSLRKRAALGSNNVRLSVARSSDRHRRRAVRTPGIGALCATMTACLPAVVTGKAVRPLLHQRPKGRGWAVSILWIILIVILVLALLGFFTRGRW
jgi:small-conductance mechanosensitive channel